MALKPFDWQGLRKCLAVSSLMLGGIAATLPDPFGKIMFGVALGLSNAAIYIKQEETAK